MTDKKLIEAIALFDKDIFANSPNQLRIIINAALENEQLRKERDELLELAKYTEKACLCQRFKTKGFDYNEVHPEMGKCEGGSRWITPSKYAESLLAKKVRDENGNA